MEFYYKNLEKSPTKLTEKNKRFTFGQSLKLNGFQQLQQLDNSPQLEKSVSFDYQKSSDHIALGNPVLLFLLFKSIIKGFDNETLNC